MNTPLAAPAGLHSREDATLLLKQNSRLKMVLKDGFIFPGSTPSAQGLMGR